MKPNTPCFGRRLFKRVACGNLSKASPNTVTHSSNLAYGTPHGQDEFSVEYYNGGKYQGQLLNGIPHGEGKYTYPPKDGRGAQTHHRVLEGRFLNNLLVSGYNGFVNQAGERDGQGIRLYSNGDIYMGQWK